MIKTLPVHVHIGFHIIINSKSGEFRSVQILDELHVHAAGL